jgi:hypothetical protein
MQRLVNPPGITSHEWPPYEGQWVHHLFGIKIPAVERHPDLIKRAPGQSGFILDERGELARTSAGSGPVLSATSGLL